MTNGSGTSSRIVHAAVADGIAGENERADVGRALRSVLVVRFFLRKAVSRGRKVVARYGAIVGIVDRNEVDAASNPITRDAVSRDLNVPEVDGSCGRIDVNQIDVRSRLRSTPARNERVVPNDEIADRSEVRRKVTRSIDGDRRGTSRERDIFNEYVLPAIHPNGAVVLEVASRFCTRRIDVVKGSAANGNSRHFCDGCPSRHLKVMRRDGTRNVVELAILDQYVVRDGSIARNVVRRARPGIVDVDRLVVNTMYRRDAMHRDVVDDHVVDPRLIFTTRRIDLEVMRLVADIFDFHVPQDELAGVHDAEATAAIGIPNSADDRPIRRCVVTSASIVVDIHDVATVCSDNLGPVRLDSHMRSR